MVVQSGPAPPPPPPPNSPTPPGLLVPIDENLWVLGIAALVILFFAARQRSVKTN
ncbi:MAG: hypothetical protein WBG46_15375 [Nonlabens sp.]